eukprot:scaffold5659_cov256-Chaetoceros_neogracile.AAC.5
MKIAPTSFIALLAASSSYSWCNAFQTSFSHSSPHQRYTPFLQSEGQVVSSTSLFITKMENGAPDADVSMDPRNKLYWEIGPTLNSPNPPSLPQNLVEALETNTHPVEKQSELGNGVFVTRDWRKAWHTYESP